MRKYIANIFTAAAFILLSSACDVIEEPLKSTGNGSNNGSNNGDEVSQKVLIEKFTGHRCNNCPPAEVVSGQIRNSFGDDVVIVSYHVLSNFAGPTPVTPDDWRTAEGTAILNYYRFVGIPIGMVNRMNYTTNGTGHQLQSGAWPSAVQQEVNNDPLFRIDINGTWDAGSRNADVKVDIEALENYSGNVRLSVFVTQDNIIAPQVLPDYSIDTTYVHNYMFRFALTNHLGDAIGEDSWPRGTLDTYTSNKTIEPEYDADNLYLVAFIRNEATHKVLQAERKKLTDL